MSSLLFLASVIKYFAIAIGVGAVTLSTVNFFIFLSDGTLDKDERHLIATAHLLIRLAILVVLLTLLPEILCYHQTVGIAYLDAVILGELFVLFLLSLNALLLTAGIIPAVMAPVMQVSGWYALGMLNILQFSGATEFSFLLFMLAFVTWFIFVAAVVNGILAYLRAKQQKMLH